MNQRDVQHLLDEVEQLRAEVEQLRAEVETRQQVEKALRQATLKLEGIGAVNRRVRPSELPLPEGDYVEVMVRDEGVGIPPEHLQRIFDPYFTTKQQGSGLGLATSYSIVANHDGHISVSSNIGQGTTFYVFLPAVPEESVASPRGEAQITLGSGRVLLMDDEEIVRQLAIHMLERLGYEVEAVEDGTKVLALYEERPGRGAAL